jgi:hypothetical protein
MKKTAELTKEQIQFLNVTVKGNWTINPNNGLVKVYGDISFSDLDLGDFRGIRFSEVTGNFNCINNNLRSLEGAPQKVGGNFNCSNNRLKDLNFAPSEVGGIFDCSLNELASLNGFPENIGGDLVLDNNKENRNFLKIISKIMKDEKVPYYMALLICKKDIAKYKDSDELLTDDEKIDKYYGILESVSNSLKGLNTSW